MSTPVAPGTVFDGTYRIDEEIGRGGMGVVYRGLDLSLERPVAIKVLRSAVHEAPEALARFKREARAVASLHHPNIVPVHAIGEADGHHYFVMKLVEGASVAELLRSRRFTAAEVQRVVTQVCRALAHAHSQGLVHRDIKPGNLVLAPDGAVTLLDFGLVKRHDEPTGDTRAGVVCGTPEYLAPERARSGEAVGPWVDIYGLGVVAYEMLSGAPPFSGGTGFEVMQMHQRTPPAPLAGRVSGINRALEAVIFRALAKRPGDRFSSAQAMGDAMAAVDLATPPPRVSAILPEEVVELVWRRRPRRITVNRAFADLRALAAEYATDISMDGCFIHSQTPPPVGTEVTLRFTVLDQDLAVIEGTGRVMRVVTRPAAVPGMGVRFTHLTARSRAHIDAIVSRASIR